MSKSNQVYDSKRRSEAGRKSKQTAAEKAAALQERIDAIVALAEEREHAGGDVFFDRRPLRMKAGRRGYKLG